MSRYSPSVLPTYGEGLGQALLQGADAFIRGRRQKSDDEETDRQHDIANYSAGYRDTASNGPAIDGGRAAADPAMQRAAVDLMGKMPSPKAKAADVASGPELASAFETDPADVPAASTAAAPPTPFQRAEATAATPLTPQETPVAPAAPAAGGGHPGAFDPSTRSFGMSGVIDRATVPQRYVPLKHGGFLDTEATPRAESARDRQAQLALAASFRTNDINQRGQNSSNLEDQKAGNQRYRDQLVAELKGQAAKEHDDRMTARVKAGEKPIMIGGNPYYKNEDTGDLEPARDSRGQPLSIDKVPQKPAKPETPAQAGADESRTMATINAQIGSTQRSISAVTAAQNAATYAEPGSKEKKAADDALATLPQLQTRLDSLTKVRDQRASAQQGKGKGPASPVTPIADEESAKSAWIKANPQKEGESVDDWRARYQASLKPSDKKPTE